MNTFLPLNSLQKNSFYLFCISFSLFVFIVRPGEFIPVLAKAKLAPLSIIFICLGFFTSDGLKIVRQRKFTGVNLMLLMVLLGFITIPFSVWPEYAFKTWWGILLTNTALFIFWLPGTADFLRLRRITAVLAFSAGVLSWGALYLGPTLQETVRFSIDGSTYDPNDMALVLVTLFPFAVYSFLAATIKGRFFWGTLLVGLLLTILKTGSRGGFLALSVAVLLFLIFFIRKGINGWVIIFTLALIALFVSPLTQTIQERFQEVLSGEDYNLSQIGDGGAGRLDKWRSGARLFAENLVTGVGVGNSSTALGLKTKNWLTIHNSYLQIGIELGVVGLILYTLLLRTIWRNCTQVLLLFAQNSTDQNPLLLLAVSTRIALVTFMVGSFFLSQAYSIILPVLLVVSSGVYYAAFPPEDASVV